MSNLGEKSVKVPPRWFVRSFWYLHRGLYRVTGGRIGTWRPKDTRWGALRLTTTGRRTGRKRDVIVAYLEDGPNLTALAMNGWADGEPAWWLNLREHPEAEVDLPGGPRPVRAREAVGAERARLWDLWRGLDGKLDDHAALRSRPTAIVVLEPRPE
ncbi:nitroreductase/quinone reductase family protein [Nocardiopsis lambiniae]|uniref:Nitroreductase/quinone reductase family protein n=1 Tax=Nocardiopsis lambiniae TaxID=3075539 RepID=A0ABU2MDW7_9ACTN|nr:nitroreductase/quinone reductase family protein [Nocardiopsis sp. DSM 44743]MDT0330871.1 nitroreductase/quinone reductase family protein [Nocardiopsis sp. DSM 44743]